MRLPAVWGAIDPRLLPLFVAVARTRSLSRAAEQLHISRSVASRQLARLEEELGVRLVQRTTRSLHLTEIGERVLREVEQVERALEGVAELTSAYSQQVRGHLRVSCPMSLGRKYIARMLPELLALYPELEISLLLDDRLFDLVTEDIDVAIRVSHLPDSSLIARKLLENPRVLVASPVYLRARPEIRSPEQLCEHDCLVWVQGSYLYDEWRLVGTDGPVRIRVNSRLRVNDGEALVQAAIAGVGVLAVDRLLLGDELETGALVRVLPEYTPEPGPPVYAMYPARKFLPRKITAFLSFVEERLGCASPPAPPEAAPARSAQSAK